MTEYGYIAVDVSAVARAFSEEQGSWRVPDHCKPIQMLYFCII